MKHLSTYQAAFVAVAGLTAIAGDPFDLSWNSIDGGGVMRSASADGVFELSGTIGQFEAEGVHPISSGAIEKLQLPFLCVRVAWCFPRDESKEVLCGLRSR